MPRPAPTVSIGIPTLNGSERLRACLVSMTVNAHPRLPFQLLVCDDGSRPEELKLNKDAVHEREWLREHAGLEMLMNEARLGIATSWNRLVRHRPADVHVLVNDDVEVVPDWLEVLVHSVWENSRVGMVGLNSTRTYSHELTKDFYEARLEGGSHLLSSKGYAFAFRREVFDEVGGFDERYFCFYEEVDFGVMLLSRGYGSYMASYPILLHAVGQTNGDKRNLDAEVCLTESRQKFRDKWGARPFDLRDRWPRPPAPEKLWSTDLLTLVD